MKTYIRFERSRDDLPWLTLGPFDYVQLTYDTIRISPEGDHLATFNGDWEILQPAPDKREPGWYPITAPKEYARYAGEAYSDVIIFSAEDDYDIAKENEWYNSTPNAHETACKTSEQLEEEVQE